MASVRFEVNPSALDQMLNSPDSIAYRKKQGHRIADAWRSNIHRITGATERSISVEQRGREVIVAADRSRDPQSAWAFLEWGTSSMRAQAPARRAVR